MSGLGRRTHYRKHLTDQVINQMPVPAYERGERIAKIVSTRGGNQFDVILAQQQSKKLDGDSHGNHSDNIIDGPQLAILPTKFRKLIWLKRNDYVIVQTGAMGQQPGPLSSSTPPEEQKLSDNVRKGDEDVLRDSLPEPDSQEVAANENNHSLTSEPSSGDHSNVCLPRTRYQPSPVKNSAATLTATAGNRKKKQNPTRTTKETTTGSIRYIIQHILYKEQIKHLKSIGIWPVYDPLFLDNKDNVEQPSQVKEVPMMTISNPVVDVPKDVQHVFDDGIVYNSEYEDEAVDDKDASYFVNTNRMQSLRIVGDSSSSSGEED